MSEVISASAGRISQQYTELTMDDRQSMIQDTFNDLLHRLVSCSVDVFLKRLLELESVVRLWAVEDSNEVEPATEPEVWDIEPSTCSSTANIDDVSGPSLAATATADLGDLALDVGLVGVIPADLSPVSPDDDVANEHFNSEIKSEPSELSCEGAFVSSSSGCVSTHPDPAIAARRHRGRPPKLGQGQTNKRRNRKLIKSVLQKASSPPSSSEHQDVTNMKKKCPICDERFESVKLLRAHIAEVHLLSCHRELMHRPRCRRSTQQQQQLTALNSKTSSTKFDCEQCGVTLSSLGSLRRHVIDQHSDAKPQYKCEMCGVLMSCASSLCRHRKLMHKQSRPHTCDVCGKAFALRQTLKQHQLGVHLKIRSHLCPFCGSQFLKRDNLRTHLIHVHKDKYHPT